MGYQRYKNEHPLSKQEKVSLMAEYVAYYEQLVRREGSGVLNVKVPRNVFAGVLDHIGVLLKARAKEIAEADGPAGDFLAANPLPPMVQGLTWVRNIHLS